MQNIMNKPETKAETQRTQEEQRRDWETDTGNADKLTKREGKTKTDFKLTNEMQVSTENRKERDQNRK